MSEIVKNEALIAHYKFDDASNVGKDSANNGMDAVCMGSISPCIKEVDGRMALHLEGGPHKTSYMKLPDNLLSSVNDDGGLTVAAWVNLERGTNIWERIIDFGSEPGKPNIFLTRNMRGVVFAEGDIAADPAKALPVSEWVHIAFTISGTRTGTLSSAGPIVYVNGEVASSGLISQTTSGTYGRLRRFFETFKDASNFTNNSIGCSQFEPDHDLRGNVSDLRIYNTDLSEDEIIDVMCGSLTDEEIVNLAVNKYLVAPNKLISDDITLATSIMKGKVNVVWTSENPDVLSADGKMQNITSAKVATLTATVNVGEATLSRSFKITVVPKNVAPYELTINGNETVCDISETLWGLFYEDINNAADGGIYAELIQNRSFESFHFDTYDRRSGENAVSTGRVHHPLHAWFGDTDKMTPVCEGGLNEFFGIDDKEANGYYVNVASGAVIYNKGFCDSNNYCSIKIDENDNYKFTIWAKSANGGTITVSLCDEDGNAVSTAATIKVEAGNWKKYGVEEAIVLTANKSLLGQFKMVFDGDMSIDMVSLYPEKVWGYTEEASSASAHSNYVGNPNYRLRKDLVEALVGLHPTFLRFPGGCISEGSYIWDNVYDWKDSVGDVEIRKENFNVWGYNMTMGLGYMEYFQLAEDLNATPLPVMACGVLCQARSDYANPAGGALQEKYIKNFTDLIDFAINTDFDNNEWAALRKAMGHEAPFDLHYLGVGNENWGPEFMASFEIFYERITKYVKENYPGYPLYVISTVGAQADDDAYKYGWKFLAGDMKGTAKVAFTDGVTSTEEEVSWYKYQKHFMETIADEHYYRPNQYLLNNADRYNYYYRAYNADGTIDDNESSKVFVGEYASSDKNTLAGAVAEAAVMTGFENNSDVVRLAATAPLFNKVLTDNLYRWTPDCIWFDNETVWYTPTYYVQQLFAKYVGKKTLGTSFKIYKDGILTDLIPRGGIEIAAGNSTILVKSVKVTSNADNSVIFAHDFANGMPEGFMTLAGNGSVEFNADGMLLTGSNSERLTGIYCINNDWTNYKVEVVAKKLAGVDAFYIGALVTDIEIAKDCIEYAIGFGSDSTGVKVFKEGIEGYKLGDFSSSQCAGNLRSAAYEEVELNKDYTITVDCGSTTAKNLICSYTDGTFTSKVLDYKLEAYNKEVFNSVTVDDNKVYIKLVNADNYSKNTKLILNDMNIDANALTVTITAANEYAHVQNVNKRDNEIVAPVEGNVTFSNNEAMVNLPANSVVAVVINKA